MSSPKDHLKLEREFIKMGLEVRTIARGGFNVKLPDGNTIIISQAVRPEKLDKQRTAVIRAGLQWPLDPKPRVKKTRTEPPPLPTITIPASIGVETENDMPDRNELVQTVTPALAEEWLERNTKNRKLSSLIVTKYARMMTDGQWHYDGSPIRFDKSENLIDGQHRLWAIIESGTTQDFLVVRNLEARAFVTIDTGKSRSFSDILSIEYPGMGSVGHVAALTGLLYRWDSGRRGAGLRSGGNAAAASSEVLLEYFAPQHDRIVALQRHGSVLNRRLSGMGGGVFGLLVRMFEDIDKEDADYFFDRLGDGQGLNDGDPILALRNYLIRFAQANDRRAVLAPEFAIGLAIKAWNAYRRGDTIRLLNYRVGGAKPEPFPIAE